MYDLMSKYYLDLKFGYIDLSLISVSLLDVLWDLYLQVTSTPAPLYTIFQLYIGQCSYFYTPVGTPGV